MLQDFVTALIMIGLLSSGHHFDFLLLQQGVTVAPNQWMLGELVGLAELIVDLVQVQIIRSGITLSPSVQTYKEKSRSHKLQKEMLWKYYFCCVATVRKDWWLLSTG